MGPIYISTRSTHSIILTLLVDPNQEIGMTSNIYHMIHENTFFLYFSKKVSHTDASISSLKHTVLFTTNKALTK